MLNTEYIVVRIHEDGRESEVQTYLDRDMAYQHIRELNKRNDGFNYTVKEEKL